MIPTPGTSWPGGEGVGNVVERRLGGGCCGRQGLPHGSSARVGTESQGGAGFAYLLGTVPRAGIQKLNGVGIEK